MFGQKPDDSYVIIWQTPLKRTRRFTDLKKLTSFIHKNKNNNIDLYYGCGLQDKDHGSIRRGKKEDIIGIAGFYADIDIKDDVHKNQDLPPTVDDAVKLVLNNGFDPTKVVHTGHGIHVHWIFKEPIIFENDEHRQKVELMCRRIQQTIKNKAAAHHWSIDSTFDVTRVLRIPGTYNNKSNDKKLIETIIDDGPFYADYTDFDEFVVGEDTIAQLAPVPTATEQKVILKNIVLEANAQPPTDKLYWLCDLDEKFKASWQNKRKPESFKSGKATPSEYALSLASIAVQAKWEDQEVANLIIAWYRIHGHDINKALRGDYIARTLAVAKKTVEDEFVKNYKENIEPTEGTEYFDQLDPNHEKTKRLLSNTLGFKVLRLVKYVEELTPWYVMYTDQIPNKGEVHFKNQSQLLERKPFRLAVAGQINRIVNIPVKHWEGITNKFMIILEEVDDMESYIYGRLSEWLQNYLESRKHYNKDETSGSKEPFVFKGFWYVYHNHFSRWCYNNRGYLEGPKKMGLDLKLCGAQRKALNVAHPTIDNQRTTKRPFKIPHKLCKPSRKPPAKKVNLNQYKSTDNSDSQKPTLH